MGNKLPEIFSKYFTGQAYLAPLTQNKDLNCPIFNVTFEPGCRNNRHSHTGGQILVVVGGKGYYQAKDKPARLLLPGDVIEISANVVHWLGNNKETLLSVTTQLLPYIGYPRTLNAVNCINEVIPE